MEEDDARVAFFHELYSIEVESDGNEEDDPELVEHSIAKTSAIVPGVADAAILTISNDQIAPSTLSLGDECKVPAEKGHDSVVYTEHVEVFLQSEHALTGSLHATQRRSGLRKDARSERILSSNSECQGPRVSKYKGRGRQAQVLPEEQRILDNLFFYFFPNNKASPARRRRIDKAVQYGAIWVKDWQSQNVTHVILDAGLVYQDLLSFLRIDSLPISIVIVNELYPASCIEFRAVLNPSQPQYCVQGGPNHIQYNGQNDDNRLKEPSRQPEHVNAQIPNIILTPLNHAIYTESVTPVPDAPAFQLDQTEQKSIRTQESCRTDALSAAINETRLNRHLPLDLDDDAGDDPEDIDPDRLTKIALEIEAINPGAERHQKFFCMTKNDGKSQLENPNINTIHVLQQMLEHYDRTQDHWRTTAYRKAVAQLKKQAGKITSAAQAVLIPGIGSRLAEKIEEIVMTQRLRRLESAQAEPDDAVVATFLKIYGVGVSQASRWLSLGYRTLGDLVKHVDLSKNQVIGIEHYDDFNTRIPRAEMQRHNGFVQQAASKIDSALQLTIGGSYRRGAADSGDIDFIVTKPDESLAVISTMMQEEVIPLLFKMNYLKVGLSTGKSGCSSKWHGAAALPDDHCWRRIDFLFVPWTELGAALIYFTGNDIFNRSIRLLASKQGMRLNQHGLWKDVARGPRRERTTQGSLLKGRDEKKIFEILGVPWRPPEHRIC